jgi:hypothetical protein
MPKASLWDYHLRCVMPKALLWSSLDRSVRYSTI